jgi:hypothetical protein
VQEIQFLEKKNSKEFKAIPPGNRFIGRGISLFKDGRYELELTLMSMKQYNQFALHYIVKK